MSRVLDKSEDLTAYANTATSINPTSLTGCHKGGPVLGAAAGAGRGRWADAGHVCSGDEAAALTIANLLPAIIIAIEVSNLAEPHELPYEAPVRRVRAPTAIWLEMIATEQGADDKSFHKTRRA